MSKDTYTPQYNGTAGLIEYGEEDMEHPEHKSAGGPIYRNGKQVVGRTYEPTLVSEYLAKGGTITKCPTMWAEGALQFKPGWDSTKAPRVRPEQLSTEGEGQHFTNPKRWLLNDHHDGNR